ncbi:unnamed protein product, partial [Scytosiphon promiscuus]
MSPPASSLPFSSKSSSGGGGGGGGSRNSLDAVDILPPRRELAAATDAAPRPFTPTPVAAGVVAPAAARAIALDEGEASTSTGGDGGGGNDWVLALVLGVVLGFCLLGACWCCCYVRRRRRMKQRDGRKPTDPMPPAPADEEGTDQDLSSRGGACAGASAGGMPIRTSPIVPPPGHDGGLSAAITHTADVSGDKEVIADLESGPKAVSVSSSVPPPAGTQAPPFAPAAASDAAGAASTSAAVAALLSGGDAGDGEGFAPPAVLLARPQNYEAFPQPFSGLDVPVRPYERSNSRSSMGGWSFVGSEAGGGLEQQDDEGFVAGSMDGLEGGDGDGEGWSQPEIDVADLVMDNNEFYTPHDDDGDDDDGGGGESFCEEDD